MGVVEAAVVTLWATGLLRQTSRVLLDGEMDATVVQEIRDLLAGDSRTVTTDLHF